MNVSALRSATLCGDWDLPTLSATAWVRLSGDSFLKFCVYLHDVSVLSVHAFSLTLRRAVFGSALEASSAIVCASEPTEILQADLHLMGNMLDSDHALAARFFRHFAGLIARQLSGAHLSRSVGVLG